MAAVLLWILLLSACLSSSLHVVEGFEAVPQNYDLTVLTVSRNVTLEEIPELRLRTTVTVDFTASLPPQTSWTYAGKRGETAFITDTEVRYAGGKGQAIARFPAKQMVVLRIGYFDTHFLEISIRWGWLFDNSFQILNTTLSSVSPGYNITYTKGESFEVTAQVPRYIGENFTWSHYLDDPNEEVNVRLDACYVDQASGRRVLSSVDNLDSPDMSSFLQTSKTYNEDAARWTLTFDTTEDVNGYFRFLTMWDHQDYRNEDDEQFVVDIWETMNVLVHNSSTPGPFPDKYSYVRTYYSSKTCYEGSYCFMYCYGYANNITEASIFKEGSHGRLLPGVHTRYENSNHVVFHVHIDTEGDYDGNYICQIVSSDGTSAQTTVHISKD